MDISTVTTAVCKSLQSLGISPRKEHQVENALCAQLRASGPEFVLSRVGQLVDWRKEHMSGHIDYHAPWFKTRHHNGCCTPADSIGSQLWNLSDKAFFAVTGAIRKSVELAVPSEKQLTKWRDGVRCPNNSDSSYHLGHHFSDKLLQRIENKLESEWKQRHWFDVTDITGTCIPGSGKQIKVTIDKRTSEKKPLALLAAYGFSVNTAPLFIWQFLDDIDAPTRMSEGLENQQELKESLTELIRIRKSDNRLMDEAMMGSTFIDDETYLRNSHENMCDYSLGFCHAVGNIGFLQQPSGKLRTVANPNRLVQYVNVPLGKVFSEVFYRQKECYVEHQEGGFTWAQSKLRDGVSLSSFDMSSATDRLDFEKYLHEAFKRVYDTDKYPLLLRSLELFEDTSKAPWVIPGHVADLLGVHSCDISWTVGQPLGLRPSFPLLTMMNMSFAREAVKAVDGKYSPNHFACVGDDLIIETKYAQSYMNVVRAYNGLINDDKCIVSDRFAEFCSHMVTKSHVYPIKPRFQQDLEGSFNNIEKFSTEGLSVKTPRWIRDLHSQIASWYLPGYSLVPFTVSSTPKPLMERLGVNALLQVTKSAQRDTERITLQTLYMRAEQEKLERRGVSVEDLGTSYADDAYPKFGGSSKEPKIVTKYDEAYLASDYGTLGQIASDSSTSVPKQIATEWDYKSSRYVSKRDASSQISQAKSLARKLDEMSVSVTNGLIEAQTSCKGVKTSLLIDTSPDNPEVLLSHESNGRESVQVIATDEVVKDEIRPALTEAKRRIPQRWVELAEELDSNVLDSEQFEK